MGKKHIIELNGKRYDALTGKVVSQANKTLLIPSKFSKPGSVQNMDGIARRRPNQNKAVQTQQRPIEKSQTLMRGAVHKPVSHKLHAVATIVDQKPDHSTATTQKHSTSIKPHIKNELVRRFSPADVSQYPQDTHSSLTPNNKAVATSSLSKTAVNAASVVISPLDQAIAKATSHQQPKIQPPKLHARLGGRLHVSPKIISTAAAMLAIVLIAGFFGHQNIPNLKMRLASSRAGLHGTLPAYQPPGFHLNDISYKTGEINVSFGSNSDNRNFIISQIASSWNSNTLREKLKTTGQVSMPVEVPDKGKTLFIYNDSNVTWVDGGVLYKIEGDSKLNSDQLVHLANSL